MSFILYWRAIMVKNILYKRIVQISNSLNTPQKILERWIKKLRDENKIEFRGSKKAGGYYVK